MEYSNEGLGWILILCGLYIGLKIWMYNREYKDNKGTKRGNEWD